LRRIALWEAQNPKKVLIIALLLLIPAFIGFVFTKVNYDILSYLPDELESVQGEIVLDEVFNDAGTSFIIVEDMPAKYTAALKKQIEKVDGVARVIWVDTLAETDIPADILPDTVKDIFYSEDSSKTMMLVQYTESGSSNQTMESIAEIKELMNGKCFITGLSVIVHDTKVIADTQAPLYISVAVLLALAIMAIMMESWIQPLVILAALGIAVLYNMGTNFFMGSISFITQCVAAVLQLGVTMDYSIFLIDRYHEELPHFSTREEAMAEAVAQSFTALAGSALTTVFGFAALCFMKLKLGFDIGFVMLKGVTFGVLTVIFVLPSILMLTDGLLQKYRHRAFTLDCTRLSGFILRHRRGFALLFLLLLIPACLIQSRVEKYYNMDKALPDYLPSIEGFTELKNEFDLACTQFVIVDDSMSVDDLMRMEKEIGELDGVSMVLAYNSVVGPAVPDDIIPDELLALCKQGGLQMFMVNSEYAHASPELTTQLRALDKIVKGHDPSAMITGEGALTQALMDTTDVDFAVTAVLSVAAIFILIAICFKSWTVPIILVLGIELAIWINLSISVAMGTVVSFVDPTVINCVQLGATVDYAILLTTRFREKLGTLPAPEAMHQATVASMKSIFQSAAVFFIACFGVYLVCDITIVRGMCALLARGAAVSACVIVLFLSPVLCVCEKLIAKTTRDWRTGNNA